MDTWSAIVGVTVVGIAYAGTLIWFAKKLNKSESKKPEYATKYGQMMVESNGFYMAISDE